MIGDLWTTKKTEKKDAKKENRASNGSLKAVEVVKKVKSKKVESEVEVEEASLGYHQMIDLKAFSLRCLACKARPRRCKVFQCSAGHLVCPTCLPSLTTCPFCNTSLPQPPSRNLCAEQCIASIVDVN